MNTQNYFKLSKREFYALLIPIAALILHTLAWPYVKPHVWFVFYTSLYLSARVGGEKGGLYATFFTALLVYIFELKPLFSLFKDNLGDYISMIFFIFVGVAFSKMQGKIEAKISQLELLLSSLGDGVFGIDRDGKCSFINKAALDMLGFKKEEIEGKDGHAVFYRTDKDGSPSDISDCPIDRTLADGAIREIEEVFVTKDGSLINVYLKVTPILKNGNISGAVAVFRDITERKMMEENLRSINRHLNELVKAETDKRVEKEKLLIQQSKMASMGEMLGAIGHQWRQPLNALGLYAQDLRIAYDFGEVDEEYIKKHSNATMELIKNMSSTIDDFRNFFSTNKKIEEFFVEDAIADILKIMSAQIKTNNIEIVLPNTQERHRLKSYKNELKQVFLNIVANAKDALLERKPDTKFIKIDIKADGSELTIHIEDSAGGIPEAVIDKIFDPYFTTKPEDKGTGIGLYMSKEIVQNSLGGKIEATNTQNGAKFSVCLPLDKECESV